MDNDEYYVDALKRAEKIAKDAGLFSEAIVSALLTKIAAPENELNRMAALKEKTKDLNLAKL